MSGFDSKCQEDFVLCSKILTEEVMSNAIKEFNSGSLRNDYVIFEDRSFYRVRLYRYIPKTLVDVYSEKIVIERGWRENHGRYIVRLTLPLNVEGATVGIIIVVDTINKKIVAYSLERRERDYIIWRLTENIKLNWGRSIGPVSFLLRVMEVSNGDLLALLNKEDLSEKPSENVPKNKKKSGFKGWIRKNPNTTIIILLIMLSFVFIGSIIYFGTNENTSKVGTAKMERPVPELDNEVEKVTEEETEDYGNSYYNSSSNSHTNNSLGVKPYGYSQPVKDAEIKDNYESVEVTQFSNGESPYYAEYGNGKYDTNSLSSLNISNQSTLDAVVLLCNAGGVVVRNVFVEHKSTYKMKYIPACSCIIKVMFGNDWYSDKDNGKYYPRGGFIKNVSFSASTWSDPFDFYPEYNQDWVEYPTYEITLHSVPNGNFKTNRTDKYDFFDNRSK